MPTQKEHLHFIPVVIFVCMPITFIITLIVAVLRNDVNLWFPYISYTGTLPPESCIFGQLLNTMSILLGLCVYIRHLQVKKFKNFRHDIKRKLRLNRLAAYFGYASCVGMAMVGNFQVTNFWELHYLGAAFCFIGGVVYFVFQTVFSYHLSKIYSSKWLFYARLVLCLLAAIFTLSALIFGLLTSKKSGQSSLIWLPTDPGYEAHVISTASEWLLALSEGALILTFLPEFRNCILHSPVLKIHNISD